MNNLPFSQLKNFLCSVIVLLCAIGATAQKTGTVHLNETNPAMRIEVKDGMVYFTCRAGCAFTDLSFTLEPGTTQLVNQYGMSSGEKAVSDPNLANFTMSARKNKKGDITIKNVQGMSFKKIKFQNGPEGWLIIKT